MTSRDGGDAPWPRFAASQRHVDAPAFAWLPGLRRGTLRREAWVGLNGAILALPQSMAYALIAGLPAEYGLYAAMLPWRSPAPVGSSRTW